MNQSFTHNKSSHGRFRGASKTSKNSRLCEPRGTFTAHGFEGAAKQFVQVFNIRLCLPSQFRLCRWESPSSALIDFSGRAWASFRSWESCRAEASGRFPTPISLGRSSLPPACSSGIFTSSGTCLNVNPFRFEKGTCWGLGRHRTRDYTLSASNACGGTTTETAALHVVGSIDRRPR